jgi:hypothetical protein
MATYFSIPNLVTREIAQTFTDPNDAALIANQAGPGQTEKEERRAWLASATTKTAILSLFEGLNPELRVSNKEGNPVALVHGIIADYDATAPGTEEEQVAHVQDFFADKPALTPSYLQKTPSGHFRLIWEFAEPCSMRGTPEKFLPMFIQEFRKLVHMGSIFAGLDEAALIKPSTYYDARGTWYRINQDPFSAADADGVFFSTVRKSKSLGLSSELVEIPMEAILDKLNERYPGRWPVDIPFVDGCRGPAVWDDTATNPTSTIYTTRGAYRFSSAKGFHSYEELLGRDFIRKWQDNKIGQVAKNFYYLPHGNKNYYVKLSGGPGGSHLWEPQNLGDVQRRLINNWNLSRKPPSHNTASEVEQAVQYIQDYRRIDALLPFVFDKREVVCFNNRRFLNTARVRVMDPAPEDIDIPYAERRKKLRPAARNPYRWGDGFPFIAQWLWSLFDDPRNQLIYLLCWIKQAYESARDGTPEKGHALFLAGDKDRGKTLFNEVFMESILGGREKATEYLLGQSKFNRSLLEVGFWSVDDGEAGLDRRTHQLFTETIKAFVANSKVLYQPKYVDSQSIPYNGRLCVTLNEDPESLKLIPDLDRTITDKLLILKLAKTKTFHFPVRKVTTKNVTNQLPYFLRWLIHWNPPKFLTEGYGRFGMRSFIHPEIRAQALLGGSSGDLLELLSILWTSDDEFIRKEAAGEPWCGTCSQLYAALQGNPLTNSLLKGLTPRLIGMKLSALSSLHNSGITRLPKKIRRIHSYQINPPPPELEEIP